MDSVFDILFGLWVCLGFFDKPNEIELVLARTMQALRTWNSKKEVSWGLIYMRLQAKVP